MVQERSVRPMTREAMLRLPDIHPHACRSCHVRPTRSLVPRPPPLGGRPCGSLILVLSNGIASSIGEDYRQDFSLPGAESSEGFDILDRGVRRPGRRPGRHDRVPGRAGRGRPRGAGRPCRPSSTRSPSYAGVAAVESPYGAGGERAHLRRTAPIAYANVEFPEDVDFAEAGDDRDAIDDDVPEIDGLRVELGGYHLRRVRGAHLRGCSAWPSPWSS